MIKLSFFPTPFPNEDFRSVLNRYHIYSGNKEIKESIKELFGITIRSDYFTIFPRYLNNLISRLGKSFPLSIDEILERHTLLPVFKRFIAPEKIEGLMDEVLYGSRPEQSNIGKIAGNKNGRCISKEIHYCPSCVKEDIETYGVCYVHREHQLAFLNICPVHHDTLCSRCPSCGESLGYMTLGNCSCGRSISELREKKRNMNLKIQKEISKDFWYLIDNSTDIDRSMIRQRLWEQLYKRNYLFYSATRIKRTKLVTDLINFYTEDTLFEFGITAKYLRQRNSLEKVFYQDELVLNLPLYFILVHFLAGSFKTLLEETIPIANAVPFGTGPWVCENRFCPDYKMYVIHRCKRIDNKSRGITGKFYCETCSRGYLREWHWIRGEKSSFFQMELTNDQKQKIVDLHMLGKNIKEIAEFLYCSTSTISAILKQGAKRSGHDIAAKEIKLAMSETAVSNESLLKKERYRKKVLEIIKNNPGLKRYDICLKNRTAYNWLKKYDSHWLELHLPPSRSIVRFSWEEVDLQLSERVKKVAQQLIKSNPNTRVGKYAIINALTKQERGRIKSYLNKMPITAKVLENEFETVEEYQIRHVPTIVHQLRIYYNYTIIKVDTILSYRKSYRKCSIEMKNKIQVILDELNRGL